MRAILISLLEFYKKAISPHLKTQCKFYPTCSEYSMMAIKKYGTMKGLFKTAYRLLRCNPFSDGGIDFP